MGNLKFSSDLVHVLITYHNVINVAKQFSALDGTSACYNKAIATKIYTKEDDCYDITLIGLNEPLPNFRAR